MLIATSLDVRRDRLETMRKTFSPREEERFQSFATDSLRSLWGAARGTLREVLGRALACDPSEVQFRYGPHGKPFLPGSPLRFNISHSGALALIALSRAEVGADVELPRRRRSDAIARRFYAPGEIERLFAETDADRRASRAGALPPRATQETARAPATAGQDVARPNAPWPAAVST